MDTKRKPTKTADSTSYEQFVNSLQLIAVGLRDASCKIDRERYLKFREEDKGLPHELEAKFTTKIAPNSNCFDVQASFHLTIKNPRKDATLLNIEGVFDSHLHFEREGNKVNIEHFTQTDYAVIIFPFFRQFIFDMTSRMAIPPVMVPLSKSLGNHRSPAPKALKKK